MRILLLSLLPPPAGGIATWTNLYINSKEAKDNRIDVINCSVIGKRVMNLGKKNIVDEIRRTKTILSQISAYLKINSYDIAHVNTTGSSLGMMRDYLFCLIFRHRKIKIVVHFHCDTTYMVKSKLAKYFFKKMCNIADKIFCLNKSSLNHVSVQTNNKCLLIPNFYNCDNLNEVKVKSISDNIKKIIYVGHITKEKGCLDILLVANKVPKINFVLVGYISDEIKKMEISSNVIFTGEVSKEEVMQFMVESDVLLFPTYSEGFPNVILEAMASGLPIISTPVGAIPDILEDKGGLYVNIGDVEGMINSIEKLNSSILRENMSLWNQDKLVSSYEVNGVIKQIFTEYSSMEEL